MSRARHNKGEVEGHKHKPQETPGTLNTPSAPLDETLPNTGAPLAPPSPISYSVLITPAFSTSIFQLVEVWSDAHLLYMNFPP